MIEPLLYFSELYGSDAEMSQFAEYDDTANNRYMATYHFDDICSDHVGVRTIWFDFYTNQYYYSDIQFDDNTKSIMSKESYIDICYQIGGTLLVWVVSPQKSLLIQHSTNNSVVDEKLLQEANREWLDQKESIQHQFDTERDKINSEINAMSRYTNNLTRQYTYRYIPCFGHWDDEAGEWTPAFEDEILPELDYIEETLFDGTHDKLHDGGLLQYHQAGKPKKMALRWRVRKSDYAAYLWFDDNAIRSAFEIFYAEYPEARMDFVFFIDINNNVFRLALNCEEAEAPMVLNNDAYQMIIFKSKFEYYRTPNYNQPRGAWVW